MDLFAQLNKVTNEEASSIIKIKPNKVKIIHDKLQLIYNGSTRSIEFHSYKESTKDLVWKLYLEIKDEFEREGTNPTNLKNRYSFDPIVIMEGSRTFKTRISEALLNLGSLVFINNLIKKYDVEVRFNWDKVSKRIIRNNSINLCFYESYIMRPDMTMHQLIKPDMIIIDSHTREEYEVIERTQRPNASSAAFKVKRLRTMTDEILEIPRRYGEFCKRYDLDQLSKEALSQDLYYLATTSDGRMVRNAHRNIYERNLQRIENCPIKEIWEYQKRTTAELCIKPRFILSGEMGTGKTRQYIASCFAYNTTTNLFVVEGKLVDELLMEFKALDLKCSIIDNPIDIEFMGQFNVISYDTLKKVISRYKTKVSGKLKTKTMADILSKSRLGTIILDECQNIKNPSAQRTDAVFKLRSKNLILGSGTIITNSISNLRTYLLIKYFKDSYPMNHTKEGFYNRQCIKSYWSYLFSEYNRYGMLVGSGCEHIHNTWQVYKYKADIGVHDSSYRVEELHSICEPNPSPFVPGTLLPCNIDEVLSIKDQDNDKLISELSPTETLDISNFTQYTVVQRFKELDSRGNIENELGIVEIMRRHTMRIKSDHPNVLADMTIIKPDTTLETVKPDPEQIDLYLGSVDDLEKIITGKRRIDHMKVFVMLNNMIKIALFPQQAGYTKPLTHRQEKVLEILAKEIALGKKVIIFTKNSWHAEYLYKAINKANIKRARPAYMISGHPIAKRIAALNDFRFRNSNVFVTPFSLCRRGYNIPQSSSIIEADTIWEMETREQAFKRILRPQQKKKPIIHSIVTKNLIDEYMYNKVMKSTDHMNTLLDGASDGANIVQNSAGILELARGVLNEARRLRCQTQ